MKNKTKNTTMIFLVIFPIIMMIPLYVLGKMQIKYLFGELAYCLFIVDSILGLRPEWIEHKIELKKLYFIHGIMAIFAVVFSLMHDSLSHLHGIAGTLGNIALYSSIAITCLALIFLSNQILSLIIPGINKIVDVIRKIAATLKFNREFNLLIHSFAPLIVVFIFLHVYLIPKFNQLSGFMCFFVGYFTIFEFLYLYYGIYKKLAAPKYKVKSLEKMNNTTYRLVLEYSKGKKVNVKSGQFIFINAPFTKINEYHPFSVVKTEDNDNLITLGIKEYGDFTKRLASVKPGASIKIKGVFGHFAVPSNDYPILTIAGGIGVTPCLGLLNSLPANRKAYLLWSVHSDNEAVFNKEIKQLLNTHPNVKIIIHNTSEKGHLNEKSLREAIPELQHNNKINCFLCGPEPMMKSVEKILIEQQVPKKMILSEGFIF